MYVDNQSEKSRLHKRTKYIDIRYYYIRDNFKEGGMFSLEYVSNEKKLVNIQTNFTNTIPRNLDNC